MLQKTVGISIHGNTNPQANAGLKYKPQNSCNVDAGTISGWVAPVGPHYLLFYTSPKLQ